MNAVNPSPQVNVGPTTPTVGALIGAVIAQSASAAIAGATGGILPPIVTVPAITGLTTWLAHWLHTKLGTPE
jgi:hypothetical protein